MSIAEFPSNSSRGKNNAAEFERTPPQDVIAEQSVLGGMLLSKDAISDVVEILRERDFYRPAHELIYDAIVDLYGRGEPADPVTVSAELTKRGDLVRAGGAPYLHTLISSVPTAANAGYYAKIIRERAIMRRLVEAGTKIVQLGYTDEGEVDDAVDQAQAEVYAVTERREAEDYVQLSELLPAAYDEIEKISAGVIGEGVKTGFKDLDALTNGFHPGNMIVLAARPAVGKSTLGLDIARYEKDIEDKELRSKINKDYQMGIKAGVVGTPTFFINGKLKNVEAGEIETTDEDLIKRLENAKGVSKIQAKKKSKE